MRLPLSWGAALVAVIAGVGVCVAAPRPSDAGNAGARAALTAGKFDQAITELKPAAENGDSEAQYLLAETYLGGHGGNMMEAIKWMTASANQGYAQAQARLALIYATGHGVRTDKVEAYRWFSLAAELADPKTQKNLKTVSEANRAVMAKQLTPQQRKEGDAAVSAWKATGIAMVQQQTPAIESPANVGKIGEVVPGIRIQLAAVKSAVAAQQEWGRLQQSLGGNLQGLTLTVETVDLGTKGIYNRVQAGPFADKAAAAAKCDALKALKQDCLVVVRK